MECCEVRLSLAYILPNQHSPLISLSHFPLLPPLPLPFSPALCMILLHSSSSSVDFKSSSFTPCTPYSTPTRYTDTSHAPHPSSHTRSQSPSHSPLQSTMRDSVLFETPQASYVEEMGLFTVPSHIR